VIPLIRLLSVNVSAEVRKLGKDKTCATCGLGTGPFNIGGIRGKCYCKRTRWYEKSTHFCAEWREKEDAKRLVKK
jgi:hypothetical protein